MLCQPPPNSALARMRVRLRPAKSDDADFASRVERDTMEACAIETWGEWHSSGALDRAVTNIAAGRTQVIEFEGTPEAPAHHLPLKFRVLKVDPAAHLYERLGFAVVETSPTHLYMAYEQSGRWVTDQFGEFGA